MEIIDFRVRPQTEYFYRNIFPNTIPAYQAYFKLFKVDEGDERMVRKPIEACISDMAAQGIDKAVIFSGDAEGNAEVHAICKAHPEVYLGLAGADVSKGVSAALATMEQAFDEYDLLGMSLSPFVTGIKATDPRYYPLYALCEQRGKVLQVHSAIHYNPDVALDIADPRNLDQIAVHFPRLRIVMSHAGFGFGDLGTTVALRHPNMYLDLSGLHPRYLPERLLGLANTILKHKVIFGTNFPCLHYDIVHAWKRHIREDNQALFFAGNARRALGMEG